VVATKGGSALRARAAGLRGARLPDLSVIEGDRQILVLDAAGNLDLARTIAAFSHSPGSGEPPARQFQMPFARIGTIMTFGSKNYVDGLAAPEALNDKGASYSERDVMFAVFEGAPGSGKDVCRFVWRAK
jgi:hypothetical protein